MKADYELVLTRQDLNRVINEHQSLKTAVAEQQQQRLHIAEQVRRQELAAARMECNVCMDRLINFKLIPCCHTNCGECVLHPYPRRYPICRRNVSYNLRIHEG
jgi:hypothetical protein